MIYCLIRNHCKCSGINNYFVIFMDFLGQEFGQGTVEMMCFCSVIPGASTGKKWRLKVAVISENEELSLKLSLIWTNLNSHMCLVALILDSTVLENNNAAALGQTLGIHDHAPRFPISPHLENISEIWPEVSRFWESSGFQKRRLGSSLSGSSQVCYFQAATDPVTDDSSSEDHLVQTSHPPRVTIILLWMR